MSTPIDTRVDTPVTNRVENEDAPVYGPLKTTPQEVTVSAESKKYVDDMNIRIALDILHTRLKRDVDLTVTCPKDSRDYLVLKLAEKKREVFAVMFLDSGHRLIKYEELFFGTIDGVSVHSREVIKAALKHNAAAIIIAHNHPSGVSNPSQVDEHITILLKDACALVDVKLLDHIIVGGTETTSLAERGVL